MYDAWPEFPLEAWKDTRDTLHLCTQIVGKLRLARAPREPDWAHVALYVADDEPGPRRRRTFQIDFDFVDHELRIVTSDGRARALTLEPRSVAAFHADVMAAVASLGIEIEISPRPQEIPDGIPFTEDERHAAYEAEWAQRFWHSLVQVDLVLKEHRARFGGRVSPVHFFWGSFDLALTLHVGPEHVSVGYWPGDERLPEPASSPS